MTDGDLGEIYSSRSFFSQPEETQDILLEEMVRQSEGSSNTGM